MQGLVNQAGDNVKPFQAARTTVDLTLLPVVAAGDYVYSNEPVTIENGQGGVGTAVDRSAGVSVLASAGDTHNNGRKLVRLSNGWLISATLNLGDNRVYFSVSKDSGATWSSLWMTAVNTGAQGQFAIASFLNTVYVIYAPTAGSAIIAGYFSPETQVPGVLSLQVTVDTSRTEYSGVSITTGADGTIHAVWSSKDATYPNSLNVRYSKSVNGGVSWAVPTQITMDNTAGYDHYRPCVVVKVGNNPIIVWDVHGGTYYHIYSRSYNGASWDVAVQAFYGASYVQYFGSAVVDGTGAIHIAWSAVDSTDTGFTNIRYSKSTDGGATWTTPIKLTSGSAYDQDQPSVATDSNNNIYIVFYGQHSGSTTIKQIRKIVYSGGSWGAVGNITSATAHQRYPQILSNYTDFTDPLIIWQDNQSPSVKFRGVWTESYSLFDRTAVSVVGSAYDCSIASGRKLVRLSNGWLVAAALDTSVTYDKINLYVSKDNGATWSLLCYVQHASYDYASGFALASSGTRVTLLAAIYTSMTSFTFDATTITNTNLNLSFVLVDSQTTMNGSCSIAVDSNGILHAAWSSKNATYSAKFNIRYSKSTDGGVTWAAPTQITASTTNSAINPAIAVKADGNPIFTYLYTTPADSAYVVCWFVYSGSSWSGINTIFNPADSTKTQWPPSITVAPDGSIHVAWDGLDTIDTTYPNIRYAKSTDNGATFSVAVKLTNGNTANQSAPSIASDTNNNIHVVWNGDVPGGSVWYNIRRLVCTNGTWGSIIEVTPDGAGGQRYFPQTCDNYKDFTSPLIIWQDNVSPSIKFAGTWRDAPLDLYTKLLLHFNGINGTTAIVDSSPSAKTLTAVGNAQISTAQSKFGGASGYFDGTGDYVSIPDSDDWNVGSGDFTIDFWIRPSSFPTTMVILEQRATTTTGIFYISLEGSLGLHSAYYYGGTLTTYDLKQGTITGWTAGVWAHVALVRSGNTISFYKDGVLVCSQTYAGVFADIPAGLTVGAEGGSSNFMNGYIDELRISKGIARWTANFTPPTSEHTVILGGSGQTIPAISAVTALSQITALATGALKTLGATAKRYIGFVSKKAVGSI